MRISNNLDNLNFLRVPKLDVTRADCFRLKIHH